MRLDKLALADPPYQSIPDRGAVAIGIRSPLALLWISESLFSVLCIVLCIVSSFKGVVF